MGYREKRLCPNDSAEMVRVKVDSHYGQSVVLEQCPECGGIWFDKSELFIVRQGEAERIEQLDAGKLSAGGTIKETGLLCPEDRCQLITFKDPYLPQEIVIARCGICDGFWLNRGEFSKYQEFRGRKRKVREIEITPEDIQLQDRIQVIMTQHQRKDAVDVLGNVGRFLSMPIDQSTMRPMESKDIPPEHERAANMIISVLVSILSLVLRR